MTAVKSFLKKIVAPVVGALHRVLGPDGTAWD